MRKSQALGPNFSNIIIDAINSYSKSNTIWVGYSGGLDSTVLLHILAQNLPKKYNVNAIHINHQLQSDASTWEQHCYNFANKHNIQFHCEKVFLDNTNNIEEQARIKRFEIWEKFIDTNDLLLLGHHKNDNVETLLFRILRGTGIHGLSGISSYKEINKLRILRPMLSFNKKQIFKYAETHNLEWVEDKSNKNTYFARNFLRNTIIPKILTKWPKALEAINNLSINASDNNVLIDKLLQKELKKYTGKCHYSGVNTLDISELHDECLSMQKAILQFWIRNIYNYNLNSKHLYKLINEVVAARVDATPCLSINNFCIRRYKNKLYFIENKHSFKSKVKIGSENFAILQQKTGKSRKKFLQALKVPSWLRSDIIG